MKRFSELLPTEQKIFSKAHLKNMAAGDHHIIKKHIYQADLINKAMHVLKQHGLVDGNYIGKIQVNSDHSATHVIVHALHEFPDTVKHKEEYDRTKNEWHELHQKVDHALHDEFIKTHFDPKVEKMSAEHAEKSDSMDKSTSGQGYNKNDSYIKLTLKPEFKD